MADDYLSKIIDGTVDVLSAKYSQRAVGTAATQQAAMSATSVPQNPQAKAQSYVTVPAQPSTPTWVWVAGGIALAAGLAYLATR